jgi:alpha-ketoglutarate-dependent 2,4-dichlorophenoxyacetate dioxygenase
MTANASAGAAETAAPNSDLFEPIPLHAHFAARIERLDLREPFSSAQIAAFEAAMDRFAVLVIPGQTFDDEQQVRFAEQFGRIEATPTLVDQERRRLANMKINDISNLAADGEIYAKDDRRRMYNLGNMLWHSDSSFKATPAKYSMLHARVIPPAGGETEYVDTRVAWEHLPAPLQALVKDLVCEHSLIFSRAQLGFDAFSATETARCAPVPQRLVRRHQGSGRLALYLSAHIGRVQGWPTPEGMMLIRELTERATARELVYRHRWSVNDLVIWDNRCTMHRGLRYDDKRHPRDLRRVTLEDIAPTLEQPL